MRPFALFVSLFGFYVALSGQLHNTYLMAAGAVCCFFTMLLAVRMGLCDDEGIPVSQWPRTLAYIPWLLWQIALANVDVARRVWSPELPISPRMIEVPHDLKTGYGIATYANSITLTPGTVTVEAPTDSAFVVHALTKGAGDDVLAGDMLQRCRWVEGQAVRPTEKPPQAPETAMDTGGDA